MCMDKVVVMYMDSLKKYMDIVGIYITEFE